MKQHLTQGLLLAAFLLATTTLQAQIPNGYYNNAEGKTGNELKTALHNIIKGHHVVSYNGLLDAYAYTDCYSDGKIWDIYSNKHWELTQDCGNYNSEGDCWNREHTWPQSWFNEQSTPRSDLFHVMPTDGYVNNRRSNYPYGEVSSASWTSSNGSKLGNCTTSGYSGTVFEPVDEYKGDIARNFFYMSVRYYSEDSGWGSSGMTNKSVIKDWAMTMLLRWSDEDPVSDKEIARNNAVYGYQNNRNPFIDHPEYARMIWDPNWTATESYNITCATGLSHGSVSAPESAAEGSTVAITAIPDPGFMASSYSAYKTGSPSTTVNVSSNGTFTMPDYDVTVSATFVENNTYYNITLGTVSHGNISVSTNSAKSGTNITMTANPESGYNLYSWYVYKTGDMNTSVHTGTTGSFTMPAFDVTVMATFSTQGSSSNGDFVKVTEGLTDWSGEYLIVYEDGSVAFNGGLTNLDNTNNTISVTINNNTIEASQTALAAKFTIEETGEAYTIKSASGYYIGATSNSNTLNASQSTAYTNTLSYNNGDIDIIGSGGAYLRYNATSSQHRFRYYKSSTYTDQKAIQLYKRTVSAPTPTHTIHFEPNGGEGSMNDQSVEEFVPAALTTNAFSREGYEFDGWNTEANGTGTYYADNANVTIVDDLTLYAQWDPKYSITLVKPEHGNISANVSNAVEDATVTLTALPDEEYVLQAWTVTYGDGSYEIEVVENQFEMPADHVTVTATFRYMGMAQVSYQLVTSADELVEGEKYLIVNTDNSKALGTTQNNNNRSAVDVIINNNSINNLSSTVCELELGGDTDSWTFFDAGWGANGGYLYAASSSANQLKTQATNNANGQWAITVTTEGVATIQAQGENTRNLLRYNPNTNNGDPLFSCYASGQQEVSLFRRVETFSTVEQTITLNKGWNWFSTYLDIDLEQLETALAGKATSITSQNGSANYTNSNGWMGSLNAFDAAKMYKIKAKNSNTVIVLSGVALDPTTTTIILNPEFNWIGFPCSQSMGISEAFVDANPVNGDKVSTLGKYAQYYNGVWYGGLTTLEPGKGYIYQSNASETKTFTFPASK